MSGEPRVRFLKVDEEIRFRPLHVVGAERITPHMMRVVFGGPEVANFVSRGEDDDIRMQLPLDFSQVPVPPVIETNRRRMVFPEGAPEKRNRVPTPFAGWTTLLVNSRSTWCCTVRDWPRDGPSRSPRGRS